MGRRKKEKEREVDVHLSEYRVLEESVLGLHCEDRMVEKSTSVSQGEKKEEEETSSRSKEWPSSGLSSSQAALFGMVESKELAQ